MTDGTDTFTPTLHRQGYGALVFEGREYTPLEWVERIARRGGTLAAGEGKLLTDEIDRLRNHHRQETSQWHKATSSPTPQTP
jgi:hypothetical protein